MKIEKSVTIERSVDDAFAFISSVENDAHYISAVESGRNISPSILVGAELERKLIVPVIRRSVRQRAKVIVHRPPHVFAFEAPAPDGGFLRETRSVARIDEKRCRVTFSLDADLPAPLRLAAKLARGNLEDEMQKDLEKLKDVLESQTGG